MTKVTEAVAAAGGSPLFICDFSPPRGAEPGLFEDAAALESDFICVAYNPGKAVRVDSVAAAYEVRRKTGREAIFNLSPRDMNRIALESRLLGAQVLGLENVVVVQGDPIVERDHATAVADYKATELIGAIGRLNEGVDHRDLKLRSACDFCVRLRAGCPSMNPSITPGLPSGGELSKVTLTGPVSLVAIPLRPSSRQNGRS